MAPSSSNYTLNHFPIGEREGESSTARNPSEILSVPKTRLEARDAIVASLVQILDQPLSLLREGIVKDKEMAAESKLIPGSSFGKHLRHVHDHYRVLLDSISSEKASSENSEAISLDYDKRSRAPPLETSAKTALAEFEGTQRRLRDLFADDASASSSNTDRGLDRKVLLSATTPAEVEVGTTLGREMWFVCLHAIHHFALARVILVHELGLKIDDNFGVAPSTLLFREWNKAVQSKL